MGVDISMNGSERKSWLRRKSTEYSRPPGGAVMPWITVTPSGTFTVTLPINWPVAFEA